jgi:hypothetical protein
VLHTVIVVVKRATRVVRRINEDAFDLARQLLFKRLEGEEVVSENKPVIEQVVVGDTVLGVIRPLRILQQNPRLQPRPVLLADPGEFQFALMIGHMVQVLACGLPILGVEFLASL